MKKLSGVLLLVFILISTFACVEVEESDFPYSVNVTFYHVDQSAISRDSIPLRIVTSENFSSTSFQIENTVETENNDINIELLSVYLEGIGANCEYGPLRETIYISLDDQIEEFNLKILSDRRTSKAKICDMDSMIVLKPVREDNATFENDTLYLLTPKL